VLSAAAVTVNEAALLRPVRGRIMGGARVNEAASALADVAVTAALAARCRASHAEAEPTVARGGGGFSAAWEAACAAVGSTEMPGCASSARQLAASHSLSDVNPTDEAYPPASVQLRSEAASQCCGGPLARTRSATHASSSLVMTMPPKALRHGRRGGLLGTNDGGRLRMPPACFLKVLAGKSCRKKSCRQKWSSRLGSGALAPARRLLGVG